jgi:putative hydrolase of the HAD superfamily
VVSAFLVDVYDTLVSVDFAARRAVLAERVGADPDLLGDRLAELAPDIDRGLVSAEEAHRRALASCGVALSTEVFEEYQSTRSQYVRLFPDAIPFLEAARERGLPVALVSNCGAGTRDMLSGLGILGLVDVAVLSCEIGQAKPSAEIYQYALARLDIAAGDAVFVDDQLRYCDGAVAVGLTAVQIARPGAETRDGFPAIGSLLELLPD